MKTTLPILLFIILAFGIPASGYAAIPPGETWTVPDNAAWHQHRLQLQGKHRMLVELMNQFPAATHPDVHFYVSMRAFGIAWGYRVYFGVEIPL